MTGTEPSSSGWQRAALDLLYPLRCPGCMEAQPRHSEPGSFCSECAASVHPIEAPFCQLCAEPFSGEITGHFTCPNCSGKVQAFEFAVCGQLSRGPVRETIHRFKYEREQSMRLPLARLTLPSLDDPRLAGVAWTLVPVPLHHRKQRERGFNQSAELAIMLGRLSGLPVLQALRRVRYTKSQAGLDRQGRLKNLKGAFAVKFWMRRRVNGRAILLVDDVFTTGATANECAETLKKAGASRIAVLTAARG